MQQNTTTYVIGSRWLKKNQQSTFPIAGYGWFIIEDNQPFMGKWWYTTISHNKYILKPKITLKILHDTLSYERYS